MPVIHSSKKGNAHVFLLIQLVIFLQLSSLRLLLRLNLIINIIVEVYFAYLWHFITENKTDAWKLHTENGSHAMHVQYMENTSGDNDY